MHPLQWFFNHAMEVHTDHKGCRNMDHMIMSTKTLLPTLQWWSTPSNLNQGMLFTQPPQSATVTMDVSLEDWGGHVSPKGSQCHINFLELHAIHVTPANQTNMDDLPEELCVACTLKMLRQRSQQYRSSKWKPNLLFLCQAHGKRHTPTSKQTIARWLQDTIIEVYELMEFPEQDYPKCVNAHNMRKMSTLVAFEQGVDVETICQAVTRTSARGLICGIPNFFCPPTCLLIPRLSAIGDPVYLLWSHATIDLTSSIEVSTNQTSSKFPPSSLSLQAE